MLHSSIFTVLISIFPITLLVWLARWRVESNKCGKTLVCGQAMKWTAHTAQVADQITCSQQGTYLRDAEMGHQPLVMLLDQRKSSDALWLRSCEASGSSWSTVTLVELECLATASPPLSARDESVADTTIESEQRHPYVDWTGDMFRWLDNKLGSLYNHGL